MSNSLLQDALRRLMEQQPGWKKATTPPEQGPKPAARGKGLPASSSSANGIAFNESDYGLREYWPPVSVTSADGLFTVEVDPIKAIALDGGGKATFKEPPPPAP